MLYKCIADRVILQLKYCSEFIRKSTIVTYHDTLKKPCRHKICTGRRWLRAGNNKPRHILKLSHYQICNLFNKYLNRGGKIRLNAINNANDQQVQFKVGT